MAKAHVQKVLSPGNDRLVIIGTVDGVTDDEDQPVLIQASGWVSAMENHYDEKAYVTEDEAARSAEAAKDDPEGRTEVRPGDRRPDAKPRAMNDDERLAYWEGLLIEQAPAAEPEPEILYQAEEA